jgi:phenylalanyl-tRNA synthetase beta chain
MKVSYNWLVELTATKSSPEKVAEHLTMVGLAVDSITAEKNDFILELDLTSNRPDCLSHLGIARELALIEKLSLKSPETSADVNTTRSDLVIIEDPDLCPRYAARIVKGVKIAPSPDWLVERLEAVGQRPINNVTDITNYVLHELGHPLHAFDLSKLAQQKIVVRRARKGEQIMTLDKAERRLTPEMLVIADANSPVAVAGVMGGFESEISDSTTDVLIESAYFNPDSVRRTSKQLGLQTEASYRFERGTDIENVLRALNRTVSLIVDIAGGRALDTTIDQYVKPFEHRSVSLRHKRVKELTGLEVSEARSKEILDGLGFENPTAWQFKVPTWRVDIDREVDLVEEITRHTGFDKVGSILPPTSLAGEFLPYEKRRRAARRVLNSYGYDEAVSFSFISTALDQDIESIPGLLRTDNQFVVLQNPIAEGLERMRPSLLPGLLGALRHNLNHGTRNVRIFEIGRVFGDSEPVPLEKESLGILATGGATREGVASIARDLDFFDLKGVLEAVASSMNLPGLTYESAKVLHLREGQAAVISLRGEPVGTIGRLSDRIASTYKFRQAVYVAELDLEKLERSPEETIRYTPLPKYPGVERDLSILVNRTHTFMDLMKEIEGLNIKECKDIQLVDIFEGTGIPQGKRSVTLRLVYRDEEKTLRDEDVDALQSRVVSALEGAFGVELRK